MPFPSFVPTLLTRAAGPLASLALIAAISAQIPVYDNGPFQSAATGGGPGGGSPVSRLQNVTLEHSVYGYGAQQSIPNRLTDNFTVGSLLLIDDIEVFGYTVGATAPSCSGVYLSLWNADPSDGTASQLIAGAGNSINLISAPGFSVVNTLTSVYRKDEVEVGPGQRIQSIRVSLPVPILLTAGTYWLEMSFNGINLVPPLTTDGVNSTGDAKQFTSSTGTYNPIVNGTGAMGLPFRFYSATDTAGTVGSITNLGGGCSTASLKVEGAPTVGGYVNPAAIGVIVVGAADPNTPLIGCTCISHASFDSLTVGSSYELQVPLIASLVGSQLFFQGGQIALVPSGGATACNLGFGFDLTHGFRYRLNFN
jgi:hypothetical protein